MTSRMLVLLGIALAEGAHAATLKCAPDSVKVGTVCVDRYEASVWQIDLSKTALIRKIERGKATLDDLVGGGAVQLGCDNPSELFNHTAFPGNFPASGQWTPMPGSNPPSPGVYTASIPGVLPSACTSWFQASQAC